MFQREIDAILNKGPRYVSNTAAIPEPGDYYVLPHENKGRALVRNNQGQIELISNVCRHRQAIMLKDRGNFKTPGQGHASSNPHLGKLVVCDDLKWEFSKAYSMQTVGGGTYLWQNRLWHLQKVPRGFTELPKWRVAGAQRHLADLLPRKITDFEPEFIAAQKAAYMETAVEDDEIGKRMDAGRRALYERGDNEVGPYQSPMEDGMQHFHAWYRQIMGAHIPLR